jgi:two-component system, chemotaxis family, protein-glutamate methylesterase/glutaminase
MRSGPARAGPGRQGEPASKRSRRVRTPLRGNVIGICVSTGGPRTLVEVLRGLPAEYAIPVLVVQHMTPGFVGGLVRSLDREIALPVRLAVDGDPLAPGVWLAPDGAHLTLDRTRRLALDRETQAGSHRPSGDLLLLSLARVLGPRAVAVVLTGMGRDGADGLAAVGAAGGLTIAQDEQSSVVFGMPRVAAQRGAQQILAPEQISAELAALAERGRP